MGFYRSHSNHLILIKLVEHVPKFDNIIHHNYVSVLMNLNLKLSVKWVLLYLIDFFTLLGHGVIAGGGMMETLCLLKTQ